MPQATINNSVYVLTDAWEKPRILFTKDGSSAYLPMTTGTAENFWVTGTNGSSYRPLVTSTTSSSESASSSTTYYTTEEYSEGLTSTTALTTASYYETTSGARGYLSSITDLTKPAYYLTTSASPGQMSSITGLTAASAYAVSGYYSESFAQYTTSQEYNPNMFSVTDLYVDRVSTNIDTKDPKWTRTDITSNSWVDFTVTRWVEHYNHSDPNKSTSSGYTEYEYEGRLTRSAEDYREDVSFWAAGQNDMCSRSVWYHEYVGHDPQYYVGAWEYFDFVTFNAQDQGGNYGATYVYSTIPKFTSYVGTSRSTTGYAGYIEIANYRWTSFYTNDSRTQRLSNSYYLYLTYTSAYSGYLSSSQTTGYSGWLSRSSTSGYSGITSSSVSTSSSMSTTTWN